MYLVFDTETTGLPRTRNAPISNVENWPRVVQIAWEAFDADDHQVARKSFIIRPDGYTIPKEAERVHGISTERALQEGIPMADALNEFAEVLTLTKILIGHNLKFDADVVGAEFYRTGNTTPFRGKTQLCTMRATTGFCQLPGRYDDFKWPTLAELHLKLFGSGVTEAHEAAADVATCVRCFFELKRRGVLPALGSGSG